eukprot:1875947-Pyramimonas_sp.AAC.1
MSEAIQHAKVDKRTRNIVPRLFSTILEDSYYEGHARVKTDRSVNIAVKRNMPDLQLGRSAIAPPTPTH